MLFWTNNRGSIGMNFALISVGLIIALAAGTDYSLWESQHSKLQDAADAGALSGAVMLGNGGRNVEAHSEEQADEFARRLNDKTLVGYESNAYVNAADETVQVDLSVPVPKMFSSFMSKEEKRVSVRAIAKVVRENFYCIYVLNPTTSRALNGNGNAVLQGENCSIQVNSSAADAVTNSGTITADNIDVVGGYTGTGYSPFPTPAAPSQSDPFAHIAIPSASTICDFVGLNININTTLGPGTYCGGVHLSGSTTEVTLAPGEYHFVDGDLKVSGGAMLIGDEVALILHGTSSMDISGRGVVATTPPISGSLEGFSIVQDRAAPLGNVSKITGEGQFSFPGIIYLPNQALEISGKAEGNTFTPEYSAIVVNTLQISGSGELKATANSSAFSQDASSRLANAGARLVQ